MATTHHSDKTVSTDSQQTDSDDDEPACACETPHGDLPCFDHFEADR